jgi:hypothetical protein
MKIIKKSTENQRKPMKINEINENQ